jgi:hypothetical protein
LVTGVLAFHHRVDYTTASYSKPDQSNPHRHNPRL